MTDERKAAAAVFALTFLVLAAIVAHFVRFGW